GRARGTRSASPAAAPRRAAGTGSAGTGRRGPRRSRRGSARPGWRRWPRPGARATGARPRARAPWILDLGSHQIGKAHERRLALCRSVAVHTVVAELRIGILLIRDG